MNETNEVAGATTPATAEPVVNQQPASEQQLSQRNSRAVQIMVAICGFALVIQWAVMGFISGIKPPFTLFWMTFEGGYQPEPGFYSTLTTLVTGIISGALSLAGFSGVQRIQSNRKTNQ